MPLSGNSTTAGDDPSQSVLRGRDMICFCQDWTGDPLSKTHVMRILARDNRVLWINSIGYRAPTATARDAKRIVNKLKAFMQPVREVEKNLFVLSPLAIPLYNYSMVRKANRYLLRQQILREMRKLKFRNVINWVFNPTGAVVAGTLGESKVVYYCVDDYSSFSDAGTTLMAEMENQLFRTADMVVVSAERLLKSKSPLNPRTVLIRHGVDYNHFRTVFDPTTTVPEEIRSLPRPIIGYFGLMSQDWIDLDLLEKIARRFTHGSLVLLGSITMDLSRIASMKNVHLLGRKPFSSLPSYCKGFDAAILPFPISEVTLNSNPLKVREYLAAGLPVVSTKIPEVEVLSDVTIGETHDSFLTGLEQVLQSPGPKLERSDTMKEESWDGRVRELRHHYANLVERTPISQHEVARTPS